MSHHGGRSFHGNKTKEYEKKKEREKLSEGEEKEEEEEDPYDTRIKKSGCAELHYALLVRRFPSPNKYFKPVF